MHTDMGLLAGVLRLLLAITLVLLCGWGLTAVFRRQSAALRHRIWGL